MAVIPYIDIRLIFSYYFIYVNIQLSSLSNGWSCSLSVLKTNVTVGADTIMNPLLTTKYKSFNGGFFVGGWVLNRRFYIDSIYRYMAIWYTCFQFFSSVIFNKIKKIVFHSLFCLVLNSMLRLYYSIHDEIIHNCISVWLFLRFI